jgi:5-deoxy-5-amino-3-dehydroquinate synthase
MIRVRVPLADRGYDVVVGRGAATELGTLVPARARRVAVVTQAGIPLAVDPGREHRVFTLGDGEAHKRLGTVEELCRGFASWGMSRADCVVGVGGGIVTDVAGFAAAVYHRGIDVVHVPTTLLGMVDAAIGGKTGVNLAEGKNLVGAFWQPAGVACDLDALDTLPAREMRCGLGEMAKYHFLTGDNLLALPLDARVARCVEIKAEVVGTDERESISSDNTRGRAVLNYGHTLAHALETAGDHDLRHGEAVAIGLVYAACLARALGRIDDGRVAEHVRVVGEEYGLDTKLPAGADRDRLVALMARDKKAIDGLTFVLDGPGGVEVVAGVGRDAVDAAFALQATLP